MPFCAKADNQPTHLVLDKHYSHPHHLDMRALNKHVSSNLFSLIFQGISTSSSKSVFSSLGLANSHTKKIFFIYFTILNSFMVNILIQFSLTLHLFSNFNSHNFPQMNNFLILWYLGKYNCRSTNSLSAKYTGENFIVLMVKTMQSSSIL